MSRAQQAPHVSSDRKVRHSAMTAPAAIVASFVQPAARLAMGDAVGGAMGGFEALLAVLTQSLQGGADGQAPETAPETDTPAETGELAALLGGANQTVWLAHTLSRATPEAEAAPAPMTRDAPRISVPTPDQALPSLAGEAPTDPAEPMPAMADPETILAGQTREPIDPALFERVRTSPRPVAEQNPPTAVPAAPAQAEPVEVAVEAVLAAVQPTAEAPAPAEAVAAPAVLAPSLEARAQPTPRKAAPVADSKVAKVETANAAPAPVKVAEAGEEVLADEIAPAEVAAHEADHPQAAEPAVRHTTETAVQALTSRLEALAAGATAFATQVRGAPETVARLAAGILDKLDGQTTRFDLQLDPHGLGAVDVAVEIGRDGKLTAQLGFDSQLGLNELRGRAQELRTALEQAGFSLADNALSFDFTGERRQQQTAEEQPNRNAGNAFARAMSALDEDLAAAPTRYQARQGLDLLI